MSNSSPVTSSTVILNYVFSFCIVCIGGDTVLSWLDSMELVEQSYARAMCVIFDCCPDGVFSLMKSDRRS